jgi:hypothetical protein
MTVKETETEWPMKENQKNMRSGKFREESTELVDAAKSSNGCEKRNLLSHKEFTGELDKRSLNGRMNGMGQTENRRSGSCQYRHED